MKKRTMKKCSTCKQWKRKYDALYDAMQDRLTEAQRDKDAMRDKMLASKVDDILLELTVLRNVIDAHLNRRMSELSSVKAAARG